MERHEFTAELERGRGRILINGNDIGAITTGLHIEVGAEGIATVTLELSPDAVKATMISDVVLEPDEAREALISLGDPTGGAGVIREAVLDGDYRYHLTRRWGPKIDTVVWVMLNPSTADTKDDDPTIRRVSGFTYGWGYGGFEVVNLFAYRATSPADMLGAQARGVDILGPCLDEYLRAALESASEVVVPGRVLWFFSREPKRAYGREPAGKKLYAISY